MDGATCLRQRRIAHQTNKAGGAARRKKQRRVDDSGRECGMDRRIKGFRSFCAVELAAVDGKARRAEGPGEVARHRATRDVQQLSACRIEAFFHQRRQILDVAAGAGDGQKALGPRGGRGRVADGEDGHGSQVGPAREGANAVCRGE